MSNTPVCWQCGASLAALSLPFSRFDVCKACGAELHVCKLCVFHAPAVAKQCREPIAEEVKDKQRSNVCDYFSPRNDAWQLADTSASVTARGQLDTLFGSSPGQPASNNVAIDKVKDKADAIAAARSALDDLFGKKS